MIRKLIIILGLLHGFRDSVFGKNSSSTSNCNTLPPQCKYIKYRHYSEIEDDNEVTKYEGVACENEFDETVLAALKNTRDNCEYMKKSDLSFVIKQSSRRQIIDKESFGSVFRLGEYFRDQEFLLNLRFEYVKGFDIDSQINIDNIALLEFYTDFNLYKKKRIVKSCREIINDDDETESRPPLMNSRQLLTIRFCLYSLKSV